MRYIRRWATERQLRSMKASRAIDDSVGGDPTRSRESGIMDIVDGERLEIEAGSVASGGSASAVASEVHRDEDIDITTDDSPEPAGSGASPAAIAAPSPVGAAASSPVDIAATSPVAIAVAPAEEGTIEVSDEEIVVADPAPRRSLQPPPSSFGVVRSRPPAPPSSRPRMSSIPSLPPPRHLSNGSSRPHGVDPWLLANKALELSHANARITELEEQVAFRDARILELEERLAKARRKLEDVESKSRPPGSIAAPLRSSPAPAGEPALVVEGARPALATRASADDDASDGEDDVDEDTEQGTAFEASAPSGSDDDLRQISGIGPRYEAALRKQGVTRLSQIAAWSDADVRQVAKALRIPKSRIVKGRWVEVAREVIGTRAASE